MKIAIVILLFISVAWAKTLTKRVKDDPAKKLEGLVEGKLLLYCSSRFTAKLFMHLSLIYQSFIFLDINFCKVFFVVPCHTIFVKGKINLAF